MKLLIYTLLMLPQPKELTPDVSTCKVQTRHIRFTRFVNGELKTITETPGNNLLVADLIFFKRHLRYVGEYSGHFIKGN